MRLLKLLLAKWNDWRFRRKHSQLEKKRRKDPPPPPTKLEELHALAVEIDEKVKLFGFRLDDALTEGLVTADAIFPGLLKRAGFDVGVIKNELLIRVEAEWQKKNEVSDGSDQQ